MGRSEFVPPEPAGEKPQHPCCRCGRTDRRRFFRHWQGVEYLVCRPCAVPEREARKSAAGIPRHLQAPLTVDETAVRLENLARANAARRANSEARAKGLLVGVPTRHYQALIMSAAGFGAKQIANALGYKRQDTVEAILRLPHIKNEIQKIQQAQRERVIAGEFGVAAMAKAASTKAARTIIEQATGVTPYVKPGDARRAAVDVLKLSGDMVEKKVSEHVYRIIKDFSTEELEAWLSGRGAPARVRDHFRVLGIELPHQIEHRP